MTRNLALIPKADILIVDDTPNNLRLLGQILGKQYKVRLAPSGQIALTAARSAPPDLILLDVMMPEMNGYEVADQLKAGQQTKEIPIIFISALDDTDSKVRAFAAGGVDYVTKPFQEREVLARVETHLSLRNLYKQAQAEIIERKQVEEELRESQELLSLFVRYSPIYAFIKAVTPTESRVVMASENYKDMVGIPGSKMVGKTMEELFPAEHAAKFTADDWAVVSNGNVLKLDEDLNGRNYTTIKFPIAQGDKTLLAGYTIDITERKRIEEALRESEEKYRKIFNNEIDAICIFDIETKKILDVNNAYLKLYGYTRDEVLQLTTDDISAERENTNAAIQKARAAADIVIPVRKHRKKDGTVFQVELSAGAYTWKGRNVMFAVARDITERKRAEESLLHRNQEMATLYETSLEINALSDLSSLLLAIVRRACELLQIPSGALYLVRSDEEALELVVEHQLPPHWVGTKIRLDEGLAGQVVQNKKPMTVEDYLTWGERLDAFSDSPARRVLGVPLKIHDQVTGVIVLVDRQVGTFSEDETRLASLFADQAAIAVSNAQFAAQLEERVAQRTSELETANRELESLSYNIAHDMRSPVRAMVGYSGILQQTHRAQLDSEGRQLLENIQTSGVRLGQMIDGFLAFLHLGHVSIHLKSVSMNNVLSELLNTLEPELKNRQVEFSVGDLPECQADPKLMGQIWAQLISNALKFTRPREVARIEIGSGEADGKHYYFVRDNGVGFDMKYSAKLFGVFQKLHYESEFEGTGIGLAIVKRIIQRHGGKVWAEAEEDKGAAFYFTLED